MEHQLHPHLTIFILRVCANFIYPSTVENRNDEVTQRKLHHIIFIEYSPKIPASEVSLTFGGAWDASRLLLLLLLG